MSSDPAKPGPEWWQQPQGPKKDEGYQGNQDSQATQRYPTNQGYPAAPGVPGPAPGYPAGQGFPSGQGFQQDQDYSGNQAYQGTQGGPSYPANQGFPAAQGYQGPPRVPPARRRRRWPLITLIVIILVLVVGDRAANAYAEDQMASQMQSSLALSGKPHVTIQGFPFLTQLAAREFRTVDVNATNETAGPGGQLEIASLTATLHGMHIHGTQQRDGRPVQRLGAGQVHGAGPCRRRTAGHHADCRRPEQDQGELRPRPAQRLDATAQITKTGPGRINIKVIGADGITSAILGNLNFNINIPKLPAGVAIQSINVTQQGLRITVTGQNTTLSQ